jgi:hypothetical protein
MIHHYIYSKVAWKIILRHISCKKTTPNRNTSKTISSNFSMRIKCHLIDGFSLALSAQEVRFIRILLGLQHGTRLCKVTSVGFLSLLPQKSPKGLSGARNL